MTSPLPLRQPLRLTFRSAERTQNQGEYRKKHSRDHLEEAHTQALRVAAETIPGVRGVEEHVVPAPVIPAF